MSQSDKEQGPVGKSALDEAEAQLEAFRKIPGNEHVHSKSFRAGFLAAVVKYEALREWAEYQGKVAAPPSQGDVQPSPPVGAAPGDGSGQVAKSDAFFNRPPTPGAKACDCADCRMSGMTLHPPPPAATPAPKGEL
jgi:hypothetical protein